MRNFNTTRFGGGRNFNKRNFGGGGRSFDRPMVDAICDNCGKNCQLPFKPTGERPVYCNDCFRQNKESGGSQDFVSRNERPRFEHKFEPRFEPRKEFITKNNDSFQYQQQFAVLNAKLDKLIKLMTPKDASAVAPTTETPQQDVKAQAKKKTKKKSEV